MLMVSVGVGGARVRFYTDVSVVSVGGDRAMCGRCLVDHECDVY